MKKKSSWLDALLGRTPTPSSADIAKQRLTVLVASNDKQLQTRLTQERIDKMKREIADVVSKYVSGVQIDDIDINHTKENSMDILQMNINLPESK